MECVVCDTTLITRTFAKQQIDLCERCGGVWCDDGELVPVVNALIRQGKIPESAPAAVPKTRQHVDHDVSDKACPRCQTATESFNYAYDSNIFLNRCVTCAGIWLDGGELRRVALFINKSS
mgnify:CR=1 FL=1